MKQSKPNTAVEQAEKHANHPKNTTFVSENVGFFNSKAEWLKKNCTYEYYLMEGLNEFWNLLTYDLFSPHKKSQKKPPLLGFILFDLGPITSGSKLYKICLGLRYFTSSIFAPIATELVLLAFCIYTALKAVALIVSALISNLILGVSYLFLNDSKDSVKEFLKNINLAAFQEFINTLELILISANAPFIFIVNLARTFADCVELMIFGYSFKDVLTRYESNRSCLLSNQSDQYITLKEGLDPEQNTANDCNASEQESSSISINHTAHKANGVTPLERHRTTEDPLSHFRI